MLAYSCNVKFSQNLPNQTKFYRTCPSVLWISESLVHSSYNDKHTEYNQALWFHSIIWHLFGRQISQSSQTTYQSISISSQIITKHILLDLPFCVKSKQCNSYVGTPIFCRFEQQETTCPWSISLSDRCIWTPAFRITERTSFCRFLKIWIN